MAPFRFDIKFLLDDRFDENEEINGHPNLVGSISVDLSQNPDVRTLSWRINKFCKMMILLKIAVACVQHTYQTIIKIDILETHGNDNSQPEIDNRRLDLIRTRIDQGFREMEVYVNRQVDAELRQLGKNDHAFHVTRVVQELSTISGYGKNVASPGITHFYSLDPDFPFSDLGFMLKRQQPLLLIDDRGTVFGQVTHEFSIRKFFDFGRKVNTEINFPQTGQDWSQQKVDYVNGLGAIIVNDLQHYGTTFYNLDDYTESVLEYGEHASTKCGII